MATMQKTGLVALMLSGGLLAFGVGAQQREGGVPPYGSPSMAEPPLLSNPAQPPRPEGEGIQFYTRPGPMEPAPMAGPRYTPYAGPSRMPSAAELAMDRGRGWLPPGDLIRVQESRGIRYASGGVGEAERAELSALSPQFNLRLLFAMQGSGDYLADVGVNIVDGGGATVLSARSQGPWFFAQLPAGVYTIDVDALGRTLGQSVRIGGAQQSRLNFYWR